MTIIVSPERLRALAAQLQQASYDLESLQQRLSRAYESVEWQARSRSRAESEVSGAASRARAQAAALRVMSQALLAKAGQFVQADQEGVAGVQRISSSVSGASGMYGVPGVLTFPNGTVERYVRSAFSEAQLGGLLGAGALGGGPGLFGLTRVPNLTGDRDAAVDAVLTWGADTFRGADHVLHALAVPAALSLGFALKDGKTIISGSHLTKELAGLNPYLTRILPQNLPTHMAGQVGLGTAAFAVGAKWLEDIRDYRNQGTSKFVSAMAVDGILTGAITFASSYAGYMGGAALVGLGAVALGVSAPAALVVLGGIAGAYVVGQAGEMALRWLDESGVRDTAIYWTDKNVMAPVTNGLRSVAAQVDDALKAAAQAIATFGAPVRPLPAPA